MAEIVTTAIIPVGVLMAFHRGQFLRKSNMILRTARALSPSRLLKLMKEEGRGGGAAEKTLRGYGNGSKHVSKDVRPGGH